MALAGGIGFVSLLGTTAAEAFGEDQGRYIITSSNENAAVIRRRAEEAGVIIEQAGYTSGSAVAFDKGWSIALGDLRSAHEGFFPALMGADAALA
jgi:phosphoribosylformylglycinamidine synthase